MASRDLSLADQRLQDAWNKALVKFKETNPTITPKISCTYRSPEEQNSDYAIGRTVMGSNPSSSHPMGTIITRAVAYKSPHNFKPAQAIDYFFEDENGKAIWNNLNLYISFETVMRDIDSSLVWGGSFHGLADNDHIETPDWRLLPIPNINT